MESFCCPHCSTDLAQVDLEEWFDPRASENACGVCQLPVLLYRGPHWRIPLHVQEQLALEGDAIAV